MVDSTPLATGLKGMVSAFMIFSSSQCWIILQRRFISLDSGCNGVVFVQMRKRDGDPSPKDIVQHMMASAAATRRHMSRFVYFLLGYLYKERVWRTSQTGCLHLHNIGLS